MTLRVLLFSLTLSAISVASAGAHVFNGVGYPGYNFYTSAVSSDDAPLSLGFTFTVNRPLPVGGLGYWDQGGDGFLAPHEVGIFLGDGATGPGPLLVSTVFPAGKPGVLDTGFGSLMAPSGFRYQPTAVVVLMPGQTYTIAGFSPNGADPWVYGGPTETAGFDARQQLYGGPRDVTIGLDAGRIAAGGASLVDPASHVGDFQFYAVNFIAVPEPSTWLMLLAGFGGLGLALRARRLAATIH